MPQSPTPGTDINDLLRNIEQAIATGTPVSTPTAQPKPKTNSQIINEWVNRPLVKWLFNIWFVVGSTIAISMWTVIGLAYWAEYNRQHPQQPHSQQEVNRAL